MESSESIQFLKESGLKIVACSEKGNKKISDFDFTHPVAVVMGSENLGISKNILKNMRHFFKNRFVWNN